jgi:hypothetical protein
MLGALNVGMAAVALAAGGGAPGGECAKPQVAGVVSDFFAAFNRGHARAATAVMDPQAGPRNIRPRGWYSVTEERRHHAFYDRRSLRAYILRRHRHGEHLSLIAIRVSTRSGRADFEFRVRRRADDLHVGNNHVAFGKGALRCARRKIFVWSMVHSARAPAPLDGRVVERLP